MANHIRISDGQYPFTARDIKALYPRTSFLPPFTPPDGFAVVFPSPKPGAEWWQRAREIAPELTELGHYEQRWEVVDVTAGMDAEELLAFLQAKAAANIAKNQRACRDHIHSYFPADKQSSANAGVYGTAYSDGMRLFIIDCVDAENGVRDLLNAVVAHAAAEEPGGTVADLTAAQATLTWPIP